MFEVTLKVPLLGEYRYVEGLGPSPRDKIGVLYEKEVDKVEEFHPNTFKVLEALERRAMAVVSKDGVRVQD